MSSAVEAVVFDVGETLVDETRQWNWWAERLGVPVFTLMGVLGGLIARGEHDRRLFEIVAPGLDVAAIDREHGDGDDRFAFTSADLYPDAVPCLARLRAGGYRVGGAGHQPERTEATIRALGIDVELIASSARWGVEKPSPAIFARVAAEFGLPPDRVAYVGDRLDNDVAPAAAAGMLPVFPRRGPWGHLHATGGGAFPPSTVAIDSLDELPAAFPAAFPRLDPPIAQEVPR